MELLSHLLLGLQAVLTLHNLLCVFIGAALGLLIGLLPGLGPLGGIALLLPAISALDATPALMLLAGVCYGAQHGAWLAAILDGGVADACAADGQQLARQGRAGAALSIAALGALCAGVVASLFIAGMAEPVVLLSLQFGDAERFSLIVLGLVGVAALASGSLLKALGMVVLGLLLGRSDGGAMPGAARTGLDGLSGGTGFTVIAIGLFCLGEIVVKLARREGLAPGRELVPGMMVAWPSRRELSLSWRAALRGTALGSLLGLLPGSRAPLASSAAYALEKQLAAEPVRFGRGELPGVAASASAGNAGAQAAFLPWLTLGLPTNALMALLLGAMTIKGIATGPQLMASEPRLFWGLIASAWAGNLMLVLLSLPLAGAWGRVLRLPYRLLVPVIVVASCLGCYSLNRSGSDVYMAAACAAVAYALHKLDCEAAPLLLGFVLAPATQDSLRHALLLSHGDWGVFLNHPLSAALLFAALLAMALMVMLPSSRRRRSAAVLED